MTKTISLFIFSIVTITLSGNLFAQDKKTITESVDKHVRTLLKNKEFHAISIGIYKDGNTYTKHFGELTKGSDNLPNDSTLYEIASVTKTMTGYLVAKAVQEEKMKLEDDIRMYLKGDFPNLEHDNSPITVKHLLTHTSGLPKFLPLEMNGVFEKLDPEVPTNYYELEKTYSKVQFLADLKQVIISTKPGENYLYSNAGAELVGLLLETVYDEDIDSLFKKNLFDQAKITSTGINMSNVQLEALVQGRWMNNKERSPNQLNTLWGTGSGMKSTLPDLMKYIEFQLDAENPILTTSHEVLYTRGKTLRIAYFWWVWHDKYGTSYNHHGGTSGIQNWIFIYPRHNLGFSIITNHSGPKTPNKLRKTLNKILKDLVKT